MSQLVIKVVHPVLGLPSPTSDGQVGAGQPNRARVPSGKTTKIGQSNKVRALDGQSARLLESRARTPRSAEDWCGGACSLLCSTPPRTAAALGFLFWGEKGRDRKGEGGRPATDCLQACSRP